MARVHVRRDDMVTVISGAAKGKSGRVLSVNREKNRVCVEGVNVRKKTVRRSQEHPQGGIIEVECPIHASNVMLQEKYQARHGTGEPEEEAEPQQQSEPTDAQDDEVEEDDQ